MVGKIGCHKRDGTAAFPVETLPLGGQVFTEFWAKKRIWRKKNKFENITQSFRVRILFSILKYAEN